MLADTTPFRDGLGQMAGILPPWVLADGWEEACKRLRDPAVSERLRGDCDRYWRFIHKGDWHRVRLQASPQYPGLEGMPFDQSRRRSGSTRGTRTSRSSPRPAPAIESLLLIGELFTDEHLAEMISHPLFCLGVDGYTASLDARPRRASPAIRSASPGTCTTSPTTSRELGTLPLEEAIRKMTAMPAQHFGLADRGELRPGMAADLVVLDLDRLADGSTLEHPLAYVEGVDEVLVNGVAGRRRPASTPARGPGRHLLAVRDVIDLRSDFCAPPTEEMWEAMRAAELGWAGAGEDANVNELERRGAELLGKEAAVFVPTCTMANLAALLAQGSPGQSVVVERRRT